MNEINRCRSISISEFENETDSVHKVELRSLSLYLFKDFQSTIKAC